MRRVSLTMRGFTLAELVLAIVIMSVILIGLSNLIILSGRVYVDVKDRTALLSDARFVIERLNREVRDALPNSARVINGTNFSCLEFTPILASSLYVDIPILPKPAANTMTVARIHGYQCANDCDDSVVIYPVAAEQVYRSTENRRHGLRSAPPWDSTKEDISGDGVLDDGYTITLDNDVRFAAASPTQRFYIVNSPVSYCVYANQITRFSQYGFNANQMLPSGNGVLMAENIGNDLSSGTDLPFYVDNSSLQRQGLVNILLKFYRDAEQQDEPLVFNLEVNIENVP